MRALTRLPLGLAALLLTLPACEEPQSCGGEGTNCADPEAGSESTGDGDGDTDASGDGDGDGDAAGDGDGDTEGGPNMPDCWVLEPIVVIETSLGTMVAQLDGNRAPITVQNFVTYVDESFYDGTIFHRVVNNFVIQGGGFEPGLVEKETMGPIPLEIHPELRHVDGAIAMARSSDPNSAEAQWYITDGAQGGLDDSYAVFGVLIDGFDVRNSISSVPVGGAMWMEFMLEDVPVDDVVIESIYCVEAWP